MEEPSDLDHAVLLYLPSNNIVQRISRLGDCGFARDLFRQGIALLHQNKYMAGKHMLQQKMESMAVVMMAEMTQFVQKHIILKHLGQHDDLKVQIDVPL